MLSLYISSKRAVGQTSVEFVTIAKFVPTAKSVAAVAFVAPKNFVTLASFVSPAGNVQAIIKFEKDVFVRQLEINQLVIDTW